MELRKYSQSHSAAWIFSDLLNHIGRRGWFSAGPSAEDGLSILYASFHIHPDDADRIYDLVQKGIDAHDGAIVWVLDRRQHNRFVLYPSQVSVRAKELNNFGKAAADIRQSNPSLERDAAKDLISLSDSIYETLEDCAR